LEKNGVAVTVSGRSAGNCFEWLGVTELLGYVGA